MKQHIKRFVSRTIIYAIILASTFYALRFIFDFFNLFYTDIDNARYLLSAMAQSQAAIIAIVITVSLVAVQLGASAYSPRIVNIFKSNPDLWILLTLYGTSMSYDFIVLMILSEKISGFYIFISYWLCASAFLALFPYVLSVMNVLSPQAVIKRLLEDIRPSGHENPFEPVADIIRGAFMRYDYETVKRGLRGMTAKVIGVSYDVAAEYIEDIKARKQHMESSGIIPEGWENWPVKPKWKPSKELSGYYCEQLNRISRLFAEKDEELTLEAIRYLNVVAEVMTEEKFGTEDKVVYVLGHIGEIAVQSGFKSATEQAVEAIGIIVERMIEEKENYATIWRDIESYLTHCSCIIMRVGNFLDDIGVLAVKKWGIYMLQTMGRSLEKIGVAIAKVDIVNWRTFDVARTFHQIGVTALNVEETPSKIWDFVLYDRVISPLTTIGKIIAHEKGIKHCFKEVVVDLWSIGTYAAERGFYRTANEGAKALAELAILDEKVVEEGLNDLKEREALQYREAQIELLPEIQKFIEAYKEHLKKLRASKNESRNKEQHL